MAKAKNEFPELSAVRRVLGVLKKLPKREKVVVQAYLASMLEEEAQAS